MATSTLPIFIMEHEPDFHLEPLHRHRMLEVGCCLEGSGTFYFGSKKYTISAGDVFIVNPMEPHRANSAAGSPAKFLFVLFEPSIWLHTEPELLFPFLYRPESFDNRIPCKVDSSLDITSEILAMWSEYSRQERGFYYQLKAHLMSICVALLRYYEPSLDNQEKSSVISAYRTIRPAIEYLERAYAGPLTIQDMASIVHLSPSRTQALFKEAAGTTFAQLLKSIRIQAAKELLLRTEQPIVDIYMSSGFQSHSAFYRAFVQNVGMKPLEYRNRYGAFLLQGVKS